MVDSYMSYRMQDPNYFYILFQILYFSKYFSIALSNKGHTT